MILAIGDSNLYPACTETEITADPDNMVVQFANLVDQSFRCWAKNGASNYWIDSHIEYFLSDTSWPNDTCLFVGWTSFEREEWPWLYSNISVCGGPDFGIPEPMKARYNQWKETLTDDYMQACIDLWHERIFQVHEQLRDSNIPHLFWTTYNNFKSVQDQRDWHGSFYKPYDVDGCMVKWFDANDIKAIDSDPFHYDPSAHQAWATELAGYAKEFIL